MQFVIAGGYAEYNDFLSSKGLPRCTTDYIFISDPTRLFGRQDVTVLCVGHYRKSPVFTFHHRNRLVRNIRFVEESGKEVHP